MQKRNHSRQYLKDGFVSAAFIIFMVTISQPIGRLLDGQPVVIGRFMAAYYAVVLAACLVLLFVGVRRVRRQRSDG